MTGPVLVAIALIIAFAAATQSITGFGFALIAVPGLALLLGPKVAVVAMSSVGVPLVIWNAIRWRHDILWREAVTTSIAAWIGMPIGLAVKTAAPIVALSARFNEASDENARRALEKLPALLDKVDALVESGVVNGERPNAADFQIAPSIGLAMTLDDLRPLIENRPAADLARRFVPDYPGKMPPVLPSEWLAPLRGEPAAA